MGTGQCGCLPCGAVSHAVCSADGRTGRIYGAEVAVNYNNSSSGYPCLSNTYHQQPFHLHANTFNTRKQMAEFALNLYFFSITWSYWAVLFLPHATLKPLSKFSLVMHANKTMHIMPILILTKPSCAYQWRNLFFSNLYFPLSCEYLPRQTKCCSKSRKSTLQQSCLSMRIYPFHFTHGSFYVSSVHCASGTSSHTPCSENRTHWCESVNVL